MYEKGKTHAVCALRKAEWSIMDAGGKGKSENCNSNDIDIP